MKEGYRDPTWVYQRTRDMAGFHTNLVEATLVREDGDVSIIACASYMKREVVSICNE